MFQKEWSCITNNSQILNWIKGLQLTFLKKPRLLKCNFFIDYSLEASYDKCINKLLNIGAINICKHEKDEILSPFFLRQKPDKSFRFILNLKELNKYIKAPHFKLEDYRTVTKLLYKNCYMTTIDLKDAYFLIPIAENNRKYFKFEFKGILYQFKVLPFGLNIAPYIFTKLMKPVLGKLRNKGITCTLYLDDFLIIAESATKCSADTHFTLDLLNSLGFIINYTKSQLTPSNICTYLGFQYNTLNMTLSLPVKKKESILNNLDLFLSKKQCSVRELAQLIGRLIAACPATQYGWLYTKNLEKIKCQALKQLKTYSGKLKIPNSIIPDLEWWQSKLPTATSPIKLNSYELIIYSDASRTGWGASHNNTNIHGFWKPNQKQEHINYLELLAAFYALKSFTKNIVNASILQKIDNTTAIAFINRMGGTKYKKLNDLTRDIWQYCEGKGLKIHASYINTKKNIQADFESRYSNVDTEYQLGNEYFFQIALQFGQPEIDLFASNSNNKCKSYVSWKPDPGCVTVDSFTICWRGVFFYAFPPFCLINKVVDKIIIDKAEGILVVPLWISQPWYPVFKKLLIKKPLIFPPEKNMLLSPFREPHPRWRNISLAAGHLSGQLFARNIQK